MTEALLKVEGVTKAYGANRVLRGLEFSIEPGQLVAFLGKNGAGKSTTMRILASLQLPDSGSFKLGGGDSPIRVALTPQELDIPPHLAVDECLDLAASLEGWPDDKVDEAIELGLRRSGLVAARGRLVRDLSGGMKRRLGIALAMLADPKLLLLDESFTGLDPESVLHIESLLREHLDRGGAVLLSSHVLDHVERIADRVILLHDGKIALDIDRPELDSLLSKEFKSLQEIYLSHTGGART